MRVLAPVAVACLAFLSSVGVAAHSFRTRNRANDVVAVTGLARQDFVSDLIVWKGHFVRRAAELKPAYEGLRRDLETVKAFVADSELPADAVVYSSVAIEKEYEETTDAGGRTQRRFKSYLLTQGLEIESKEVDRIERVSREVTRLIDAGVEFYSQAPEYYSTRLGELKLAMIAAATRDGRQRAERIVENAGGRLGPLRYSSLGVFQITTPNSSADFSWSGAFDTTSKRKSASVTIKLQFGLD